MGWVLEVQVLSIHPTVDVVSMVEMVMLVVVQEQILTGTVRGHHPPAILGAIITFWIIEFEAD